MHYTDTSVAKPVIHPTCYSTGYAWNKIMVVLFSQSDSCVARSNPQWPSFGTLLLSHALTSCISCRSYCCDRTRWIAYLRLTYISSNYVVTCMHQSCSWTAGDNMTWGDNGPSPRLSNMQAYMLTYVASWGLNWSWPIFKKSWPWA